MYPLAVVSFIIALITGGVMLSSHAHVTEMRGLQSQAIASNLTVYSGFVRSYVAINPSASGLLNDGALGLPPWFSKHPNVTSLRQGSNTFVYVTNLPHWQMDALVKHYASGDPMDGRFGIKQSGVLRSRGNSPLTVPVQVPEGAFVVAL